jgi:hypothetical protein
LESVPGHGSFTVPAGVTSILIDSPETGHPIAVRLTVADESGIPIVPDIQAQVQVGSVEGSRPPYRVMLPINTIIQIPREGRYTAQVTAGDSINNTEFDVLFVGKKAEIAPAQKGRSTSMRDSVPSPVGKAAPGPLPGSLALGRAARAGGESRVTLYGGYLEPSEVPAARLRSHHV